MLAKFQTLKLVPFLSLCVSLKTEEHGPSYHVCAFCCVYHPCNQVALLSVPLACGQMVACSSWKVRTCFCLLTSLRCLFSPCQFLDSYSYYLHCLNVLSCLIWLNTSHARIRMLIGKRKVLPNSVAYSILILEVELAFRVQKVFIKKQNPLVMKGNII